MSGRATRCWRLKRIIVNPLATVLLGAGLLIDATQLPYGRWSRDESLIRSLFDPPPRVRGVLIGGSTLWPQIAVATLTDGGHMRLLRPDTESWDEATRILAERPGQTLTMTFITSERGTGFWAITHRSFDATIQTTGGGELTPELVAHARLAFVNSLFANDRHFDRALLEEFKSRDIHERRILWPGVAHTTAAAIAAIAFLWSLAWISATPAWVRGIIAARRTRAGLCPFCSYNLVGASSTTCPECGRRRV